MFHICVTWLALHPFIHSIQLDFLLSSTNIEITSYSHSLKSYKTIYGYRCVRLELAESKATFWRVIQIAQLVSLSLCAGSVA